MELSAVSYIFAVGLATFSVGVIAGGWLADCVAPRQLALASGAGMVAGLCLAAWAPSLLWIGLGFGVLQGAAAGLGYATAVHEAGLVNHGLALALVVSAYGAGSAVLAQPVAWLLATLGHTVAFGFLALFAAITCSTAAFVLPNQAPRHSSSKSEGPTKKSGLRMLLGLFWLMFGLGSAPGLISFALASAFVSGAAYGAVIAVNLGNLGGRLAAGVLSDRLGPRYVLHGNSLFLAAACGVLIFAENVWLSLVGLLMIGLQYGAMSTLLPLSVRASVPIGVFGRCFGIVFSAWGICGLLAPVAAATLISMGESVWVIYAMLACGLMSWLAMTAAFHRSTQIQAENSLTIHSNG